MTEGLMQPPHGECEICGRPVRTFKPHGFGWLCSRCYREERAERVYSLRSRGLSHRAIADMLGINRATVSRDLDRAIDANGSAPLPTRIWCSDGKTYPARVSDRRGAATSSREGKSSERPDEDDQL